MHLLALAKLSRLEARRTANSFTTMTKPRRSMMFKCWLWIDYARSQIDDYLARLRPQIRQTPRALQNDDHFRKSKTWHSTWSKHPRTVEIRLNRARVGKNRKAFGQSQSRLRIRIVLQLIPNLSFQLIRRPGLGLP